MNDNDQSKAQLCAEIDRLRAELSALHGPAKSQKTSGETEETPTGITEAEERLALALRGANDGLWDWELETNEVFYSPRWKSMLGYEEDELPNVLDTWASLVHPDDKQLALDKVRDYIDGKADSYEIEMRMRHKDGRDVVVLARALLVRRPSDQKPIRLVGTHVDITERKKAESYIQKNSEILEMIAKGAPAAQVYDAIALMYEGRHPGMRCSMLELHENKLLHGGAPSLPKAYCDAVHGLEFGPDIGSCGTSTYTGKQVLVENIETDPKWKDLKAVAMPFGMRSCWSEPIKDSAGKVLGAFGMYYDHPALPDEEELEDLKSAARLAGIVMERDQAQKRIRQLAYQDELTGLASRARFFQHIDVLIKTAARYERRFSLLFVDLDDFKQINDSLGHDVGDAMLREIAGRLAHVGREMDFVARLSGDEFCILVENVDDNLVAARVAQRCLDIVSEPLALTTRTVRPACSIGIAHYPEDGTTANALLKAGDTAMYAAKSAGKNRYAFYEAELTRLAERRFRVEEFLRQAIDDYQLSLVYQPQVDLIDGGVIGVEALSRWRHEELGQVEPVEFIATAERIGMMPKLTEAVLYRACEQVVEWREQGLTALRVAVNVSPSHFLDRGIVKLVKDVLASTGLQADCLELEVTETVTQTDPQNQSVLRALKELGVVLAIDDFGTGYSSFASLKHLNVDHLKIDKVFTQDMLNDSETRLLVGSMVEMGHNLGHRIIAEGVETADQLALLKTMNCDVAQGNYLAQPMVAAAFADWLAERKTSDQSATQV